MSLYYPEIKGGLQPQARSGHTAALYNGKIIIHGGYNETFSTGDRNDIYMPTNEIWCYDIEVSQWTRIGTKGDHPVTGISGAVSCVVGDSLILFGGFAQNFGRLDLVFELNLSTLVWRNLSKEGLIHGARPSKRDKFVCWVHQSQIAYFGGFGYPPNSENGVNGEFCYDEYPIGAGFDGIGWNNFVCVLDLSNPEEFRWRYPDTGKMKPSPRAAHAGTKVSNKGYVFGGRHKDERLNDMFYLDLDKYKWSQVEYNSPAPKGRSWNCLQSLSERKLFLFGGIDTEGDSLSDMWLFDTATCVWNEIEHVKDKLGQESSRIWHTGTGTTNSGQVLIFGGCTNSVFLDEPNHHCNSVVIYCIDPPSLEQLCIKRVIELLPLLRDSNSKLPRHIQERIYPHMHAMGLSIHSGEKMNGYCVIL
eukprot:Seg4189.1 transcript_id=Seg4189.1/GoldUCD/mRNA.D3Y31 product="Kelch domain-containing protein 2" protein_id=Seg4189.1/GoldUCD/D3Y31